MYAVVLVIVEDTQEVRQALRIKADQNLIALLDLEILVTAYAHQLHRGATSILVSRATTLDFC